MPFGPDQMLSKYRLLEKLGQGGMGVVWRALDTELDREVALKLLPAAMSADTERLKRFEREARAVAALNHPNIVTLYSVEETDGRRFLTMELVDGTPLDRCIEPSGQPLAELLELALPLCNALAEAHGHGITHRDLKPSNLMLSKSGLLKVLDFGLAKVHDDTQVLGADVATQVPETQLTRDGLVLGTPYYMSPEQAEARAVDHRSDLFSLGVILYQLATGRVPFEGTSHAAVFSAILRDQPAPPSRHNHALPREFDRVVMRCLEKDPAQRYQSAQEVHDDLDRLRIVSETGSGLAVRLAHPARRRSLWLVTILALVLAAVGINAFRRSGARDRDAGAAPVTASVAVLPFVNLSADASDAYISDGMTEELIHALLKLDGLRVPARTSVFALRGKGLSVQEVGRRLDVGNVLEGSVRRNGDRLRVTAQLVNTGDGFSIWSRSFDRQVEDLFEIQAEIATAIASNLQVALIGKVRQRLAERPTDDLAAYSFDLQGRYYMNQRTEASLHKAIEMFGKAIEADPGYARAHAGLSDGYSLLPGQSDVPYAEVADRARQAANRAIELDDSLAAAHVSLATTLWLFDHLPAEAEREYRRAIELDPKHTIAHHWLASLLLDQLGRPEEALVELRLARQLDPLSPNIRVNIALALLQQGQTDAAIDELNDLLTFTPDFVNALTSLAEAYVARREFEPAIAALVRVRDLGEFSLVDADSLGRILHLQGRHDEELREATTARTERPASAGALALVARALIAQDRPSEVLLLVSELLGSEDIPAAGEALREIAAELLIHGHEPAARQVLHQAIAWYRDRMARDPAAEETLRLELPVLLMLDERWDQAAALYMAAAVKDQRGARQLFRWEHLGYSGCLAARNGDPEAAQASLQQLEALRRPELAGAATYWQAVVTACMDDAPQSVALLRSAFAQGFPDPWVVHQNPLLRPLWPYPPYRQLLDELSLPAPPADVPGG